MPEKEIHKFNEKLLQSGEIIRFNVRATNRLDGILTHFNNCILK